MRTYARTEVEVDDEGFFTDPGMWKEAMATEIASAEGIAELTGRHWEVVEFVRHEFETKGAAPNVRALAKTSGVPIKELYQLFPKGPGQAGRQDRRRAQAPRLHLTRP